MKISRLPKEYVDAISPEKLVRYLEAHGWNQTTEIEKDEVVVYRHPTQPEADILVPLTRKYADYLNRVADAISTVGAVEERPYWEVYMDMSGRYYVGPHTYSTTPLTNGSVNGVAKQRDELETTQSP
jgi:hypothetical protein